MSFIKYFVELIHFSTNYFKQIPLVVFVFFCCIIFTEKNTY